MRILHQDPHLVAIDKPEGHFVHPPEASPFKVPKDLICLHYLSRLLGRPTYPVHRLDAPTSGLVLFAFSKPATRRLARLFARREVKKTYHAVARGYLDDLGVISLPLRKGLRPKVEAETRYRTISRLELPHAVGNRYQTARYSLVEVQPVTGRWHQIRRHFDQVAHPLLGDIEHGDSHHNRFFRDHLRVKGLCLRATRLELTHPWSGQLLTLEAPPNEKWDRIQRLFGVTGSREPR